MNKTQTRGNCPCCGREQAVLASGRMSKHGYTVEHGWFNGVCLGDRHAPMQVQREVTDQIVFKVRHEVKDLEARASDLRSGRATLGLVKKPGVYTRRDEEPVMVQWKDLPEYSRAEVLRNTVYNIEARARAGTSFANDLEALVNRVHGQPLTVVELEAAPAPIQTGDRRLSPSGVVLIASYAEKGRVYFKTTEGRKGWYGVQAWRKLAEG